MGCEHVAAIAIPTPPPIILTIVTVRGGRDFSERDRRVLDLVRPHLVHAYDIATAASERSAELAQLTDAIDAAGAAAILLSSDGRIRLATARARQLLRLYFGEGPGAERLPEPIAAWLAAGELPAGRAGAPPPLRRPLVVARDRARLTVRQLEHGNARVLLLDQERTSLVPEDLASLGLSPREAEVLTWLTLGKTDGEIGAILGISPRTVSHTLEHVYRKLGVAGRAAAAACAWRTARDPTRQE